MPNRVSVSISAARAWSVPPFSTNENSPLDPLKSRCHSLWPGQEGKAGCSTRATCGCSASQRAIGTGVLGGVFTGTVLAVAFVPVFFVVVRSLFRGSKRQQELNRRHAEEVGISAHE